MTHGSQPPLAPDGKLIALDVSTSRIGVAVCDPLQLAVRPLTVIQRTTRREDFDKIAELMRSQQANAVICGLPLNMDGSEGDQARTVRRWAMRLAHSLRAIIGRSVPILFWDERLSTYAANAFVSQETQAVGEDAVAAAIILQRYLDRDPAEVALNLGAITLPERLSDPAL